MARTKSIEAHQKVLEATLSLFAERGIDGTSVDAIAEASGVSKATVYKHWHDKDALALEALSVLFGLFGDPPEFNSGDLRRDIVDILTYQPATARPEMKERIMPHVMAYAARNQEFGGRWRSRMIELPQKRLKALLKRATAKGQLEDDIDVNTTLAQLLGPMLYWRIFVGGKSVAPPRELANEVVNAFWKAYAQEARQRRT